MEKALKLLTISCVAFLFLGCAHRPKTIVINKPVATPCITDTIRLTTLPIEGIKVAEVREWIKAGDFDKIQNVLFASFILLNEDVKVLRSMLEACK